MRIFPALAFSMALAFALASGCGSGGGGGATSGTCGPAACGDTCSDPRNCGACGSLCALGALCSSGVCACPKGMTACSGKCIDLNANPSGCQLGSGGSPAIDAGEDVVSADAPSHDAQVEPADAPTDSPITPPPDSPTCSASMFSCGAAQCKIPEQYCLHTVFDGGSSYECAPTNQSICGCTPTCGCVMATSLCSDPNAQCQDGAGAVTFTCHVQKIT